MMKDDSRIPPDSSLPFFPPFSPSPEFGIQFSTKTDETTAERRRRGTLKQQITSSGSSIITRHLITADGCRVWAILRRLSRLTPRYRYNIDTIAIHRNIGIYV